MNLNEINELITHLEKDAANNKELILFYNKKRKELLKTISIKIQTIIDTPENSHS